MKAVLASSSRVRPTIATASRLTVTRITSNQQFANSTRATVREDLRYGLCLLLSSSSLRCDCSLTQCASNNSIGSLPLTDFDWLVRVESDNARISSRISASRSGGSGDMLIYVRNAADLKLCLLLDSFFADEGNRCCTPDRFRPAISGYSRARE